jgi:hypothetical protein
MVCKYGKSTGKTCGTVFSTNYTPGTPYDPGATGYVQVINALQGEMGCPGDSGSPVFEETGGTVSGVGIYSGQQGDSCDGIGWFFFYSSVNALDTTGYKILTTHYTQYKYQTVWRSATDCKEYYRMMDENGNAVGPNVEQTCPNSTLPPGSSGEIYSYTAYITGNQLRESMWRGNTGYTRLTPLNNNGTVNWPATNGWLWCCNGTPPQAQGAFVVGNQYNQTVYGSTTDCKRYSRALNNAGQPSGATTVVNCTGQFVPPGLAAGAQMKTYTAFAIAGTLREELWIDGKGYLRNVPLTADNKAVNWNSAPAWNHCCDGAAPLGQGAYIVSRP